MLQVWIQRYIMLPGLEPVRAKQKTVKDIYTWVSCFALYVSVIATKNPDRTPAMMAHLLTILRAQREYEEDPAWRTYDESFREMAASTGLKDWSKWAIFTIGSSLGGGPAVHTLLSDIPPSFENVQVSQGIHFLLKGDS